MTFQSLWYPIFILGVMFLYYAIPGKLKKYCLLLASLSFYALYNWKALPCLILYFLFIYFAAIGVEKHKRWIFILLTATSLLPLIVVKYVAWLMQWSPRPIHIISLLGISYITFKSIGYMADVYKGKREAERDFVALSLFISFFPEVLVGPIDRADNLLVQINNLDEIKCKWNNLKKGLFILLWGYFQKMVIADRLGILVDQIYEAPQEYAGFEIALAAVFYSLQIYIDFMGCTNIVIGTGHLFGLKLPENFRQPYLAISVTDFWRRWHISLTSWLKDYIYIPLGGNRKGVIRRYLNIMIVFCVSGIWHGAGLSFLFWGGFNGALQVFEGLVQWSKKGKYNTVVIWMKRLITFIMMTIAWIFFRAPSITQAVCMLRQLVITWNPQIFTNGRIYELGLSKPDMILILILFIITLIIDLLREHNIDVYSWITNRHFLLQCIVLWVMLFGIIVFAVYGKEFDGRGFIYITF